MKYSRSFILIFTYLITLFSKQAHPSIIQHILVQQSCKIMAFLYCCGADLFEVETESNPATYVHKGKHMQQRSNNLLKLRYQLFLGLVCKCTKILKTKFQLQFLHQGSEPKPGTDRKRRGFSTLDI